MNRQEAIARAAMFRIGYVTINLATREVIEHRTQRGHVSAPRKTDNAGHISTSVAKRHTRSTGLRCVSEQRGEDLRKVATRRWADEDTLAKVAALQARTAEANAAAAAKAEQAEQEAKVPA